MRSLNEISLVVLIGLIIGLFASPYLFGNYSIEINREDGRVAHLIEQVNNLQSEIDSQELEIIRLEAGVPDYSWAAPILSMFGLLAFFGFFIWIYTKYEKKPEKEVKKK